MKFLLLSFYALGAWLIHAGLLQFYINRFDSSKSLAFRTIHLLEIGFSFTVASLLYLKIHGSHLSAPAALAVVLATLALIDMVVFIALPNLRQTFDVWHFVAAYLVVVLVVIIAFAKHD